MRLEPDYMGIPMLPMTHAGILATVARSALRSFEYFDSSFPSSSLNNQRTDNLKNSCLFRGLFSTKGPRMGFLTRFRK
jgi:hypothetical protein